jgi:hypothetical protein
MIEPAKLILPLSALITIFVLAHARLPRRVLIASIGFGLAGALIFAGCYLLWPLGGIAHRVDAGSWALGLNILNLGIGVIVVNRLYTQEESPAQRDRPAEEGRPTHGGHIPV